MDRKYQWSKFSGANRDEQLVVRCDNWDEFLVAVELVEGEFFITDTPKEENPSVPASAIPLEQFEKECQNCGGEKVLNPKTGKWFCKVKCWLK